MGEQVSEHVGEENPVQLLPGAPHAQGHNSGRPISWVGTMTTVIGFVIGGIAFPIQNPAPNWVLFWVGAAVAIVGCLVLLFSKAMSTDWY